MVTLVAVPVGIYTAREAGQLAGVSGIQIGQWERRGYIEASRRDGPPNLYSFQDVLEAIVVHELIDRGVSRPKIFHAIDNLRSSYEDGRWPLSRSDLWLDLDSGELLVEENEEVFEISTSKMVGQGRHRQLIELDKVARDLERGGWAARKNPRLAWIEVDPDRLSGTPTIRGRRLPAERVARIAMNRNGRRLLRTDYELTGPEINDAVAWWKAVETYQAA